MLSYVVGNYNFLKLPELGQLKEYLLIEVFEMVDCFNQVFLRHI